MQGNLQQSRRFPKALIKVLGPLSYKHRTWDENHASFHASFHVVTGIDPGNLFTETKRPQPGAISLLDTYPGCQPTRRLQTPSTFVGSKSGAAAVAVGFRPAELFGFSMFFMGLVVLSQVSHNYGESKKDHSANSCKAPASSTCNCGTYANQ